MKEEEKPGRNEDWALIRRLVEKYGDTSPVDWDPEDNAAYWAAHDRVFPPAEAVPA